MMAVRGFANVWGKIRATKDQQPQNSTSKQVHPSPTPSPPPPPPFATGPAPPTRRASMSTWGNEPGSNLHHAGLSPADTLIARHLAHDLANMDDDVANALQSIEHQLEYYVDSSTEDDSGSTKDKCNEADNSAHTPLPVAGQHPTTDQLQNLQAVMDTRTLCANQLLQATRLADKGWSVDTILCFLKLARRGHEPIFPCTWHWDYPRFPQNLFSRPYPPATTFGSATTMDVCSTNDPWAFVKPLHKSDFAARRAFDDLLLLGRDVREYMTQPVLHKSLESKMYKRLRDYLKWSWKDGGLLLPPTTTDNNNNNNSEAVDCNNDLPRLPLISSLRTCVPKLVVVVRNRKRFGERVDIDALQAKLHARLRTAARAVLEALRVPEEEHKSLDSGWSSPSSPKHKYRMEPPTLWGLAIHKPFVAAVAYEPLNPADTIRPISFYRFDLLKKEAWNAISLAVLLAWIRQGMLRMHETLCNGAHDHIRGEICRQGFC